MKLFNKIKSFCALMHIGNEKYLKWTEANKVPTIAIFACFVSIVPKVVTMLFLLGFMMFRFPYELGNWWYELSNLDEERIDDEEGNNQAGC